MSTASIAGDRIRSFVERVESIEEEIKGCQDARKDVYSEAKGEGFDVAVLKEIVARRKKDKDKLDEEASLLDLYEQAMQGAADE